jgi:hypothetical protein
MCHLRKERQLRLHGLQQQKTTETCPTAMLFGIYSPAVVREARLVGGYTRESKSSRRAVAVFCLRRLFPLVWTCFFELKDRRGDTGHKLVILCVHHPHITHGSLEARWWMDSHVLASCRGTHLFLLTSTAYLAFLAFPGVYGIHILGLQKATRDGSMERAWKGVVVRAPFPFSDTGTMDAFRMDGGIAHASIFFLGPFSPATAF